MDTSTYGKGAFISAQEVKDSKAPWTVTVQTEGEFVDMEDGKTQLVLLVSHDGTNRRLGVNKTNWATLVEAWGTESKLWVGRALTLTTHKVTFRGQIHDGLQLTPVTGPAVETVLPAAPTTTL